MSDDIKRDKKSEKVKRRRENKKKRDADRLQKQREKAELQAAARSAAAKRKAEDALRKKERDELIAKQRAIKAQRKKELREEKDRLAEVKRKKRLAVYSKIKSKLKNPKAGFGYSNFGLLPRVELGIRGDKTSIASRLAAAGINVSDICVSNGETCVKIRKKDLRKAVAILNEMCYTHKINATYGMGRRCTFFAARFGLIVGAIAAAVSMNIAYGYIWRIDISGNDKLSSAAIEAALKAAGVSVGCKKTDPFGSRVAAALESMNGIADASCETIGTTLYVRVLEAEDFVATNRYGEYRAAYDATVTRLAVRHGTALVERGDVVKIGQPLVSGDVYSTSGELLYTADCDADVYGNVSLSFTAQVSRTAVDYRRTGRSKTRTVMSLFGKSFGKSRSPYPSYEMIAHTANYDVLIPLYVTSYTYYETKPVEYERDIDEVCKSYAASVAEKMEFAGEFDSSYSVTESVAGLYTVHLFLSGEALISTGVPRSD